MFGGKNDVDINSISLIAGHTSALPVPLMPAGIFAMYVTPCPNGARCRNDIRNERERGAQDKSVLYVVVECM